MLKLKRTAVLVVHGMGSQRPLDTARGVVDAVWLKGEHSVESESESESERRIWTHPKRSGVDIDLPVITTNFMEGTKKRRFDFHELYWAHLMSETRAVAVLLWLFELVRKGPRLKPEMNALWWGAAIFLNLMILSVTFLVIQGIERLAFIDYQRQALLILPVLMLLAVALPSWWASSKRGANKLAAWATGGTLGAALLLLVFWRLYFFTCGIEGLATVVTYLWPALFAALATWFLMGSWGLKAFVCAFGLSLIVHIAQYVVTHEPWVWYGFIPWNPGVIPWNLDARWSAAAAWGIIVTYLILYAAFLQPYLGDAARYFRDSPANVAVRREIRKQAVDTLDELHRCGEYDRIVVVAHSLGTVVAYDMLRAYYGRICSALPKPSLLGPDLGVVDNVNQSPLLPKDAREKGRSVIARIAQIVDAARERIKAKAPHAGDEDLRDWLVTDFVTMGSPLTHALYLMCRGDTEDELEKDFKRRTHEREFPTCPPLNLDGAGRLTFKNPNDHLRYFHHGGQFGLTRWTNLYFPLSQLLWGDAIGGPVGRIKPAEPKLLFGENVADVKVFTNKKKMPKFFTHTTYWDTKRGDRTSPHIVELQKAIDLEDVGTA